MYHQSVLKRSCGFPYTHRLTHRARHSENYLLSPSGSSGFLQWIRRLRQARGAVSLFVFILIAGSAPSQNGTSARPLPPVGRLVAAREMGTARGGHTATVLPDFRVLIAGGRQEKGLFLNSIEIYDPTTETFSAAGKMSVPREAHVAAALGDGKILFAGGRTRGAVPLSSSDEYDPETEEFTPRGLMHARRVRPTARAGPGSGC